MKLRKVDMNSVSCLAWVKRGASKRNPDRVVLNDKDLKKVIDVQGDKLEKLEVGDEESNSDSDSEEPRHKSAAASKDKVGVDTCVKYMLENVCAFVTICWLLSWLCLRVSTTNKNKK